MSKALATPGNGAATFLTLFFGPGLAAADRYVAERLRAMADGDIRRRSGLPPLAPRRLRLRPEIGYHRP